MEKSKYRPRVIDKMVEEYLSAFSAVCIEGPKWCGKTWTSSYHNKSEIFIGDPSGNFQNRKLAELQPVLVLEGETPRLVDEWQEVPRLWDAVRCLADQRADNGQFILTGSARIIRESFTAAPDVWPSCACVLCRCMNREILLAKYLWRLFVKES